MPPPYGQSLALLTDLYQLTMASGYWGEGLANREAVFHYYFRKPPFGGAFAIAAGLETWLQWLRNLRFRDDDIAYLAGLKGQRDLPLFEPDFLDFLGGLSFRCNVEAVPEGTVVFAEEPVVRVRGPLLQCQLAETALLNIVNFQTLIATKSARVCLAAGSDPVLEFGLRRAQGVDGGLSASRAAYIGGCAATSNVLAGKLFGIPVRGTHAHSWVLAFDSEQDAFAAFARRMPQNCVLLVDTFETLEGIRRAAAVGCTLRERGFRLSGIRLDSGDFAQLSIEARRILDASGLEDTAIIASNDLDEFAIADLKGRGSRISVWGVGTSIASARGQSALGGVYKLAMLRDASGRWNAKAKRSEDASKASTPGMLQVRRYRDGSSMKADLIYDELNPPTGKWAGAESRLGGDGQRVELGGNHEDLLRPVLRAGQPENGPESLEDLRERCRTQLSLMPTDLLETRPTRSFPVLLEDGLTRRREELLSRPPGG